MYLTLRRGNQKSEMTGITGKTTCLYVIRCRIELKPVYLYMFIPAKHTNVREYYRNTFSVSTYSMLQCELQCQILDRYFRT